jgi:hypothetical protein
MLALAVARRLPHMLACQCARRALRGFVASVRHAIRLMPHATRHTPHARVCQHVSTGGVTASAGQRQASSRFSVPKAQAQLLGHGNDKDTRGPLRAACRRLETQE